MTTIGPQELLDALESGQYTPLTAILFDGYGPPDTDGLCRVPEGPDPIHACCLGVALHVATDGNVEYSDERDELVLDFHEMSRDDAALLSNTAIDSFFPWIADIEWVDAGEHANTLHDTYAGGAVVDDPQSVDHGQIVLATANDHSDELTDGAPYALPKLVIRNYMARTNKETLTDG